MNYIIMIGNILTRQSLYEMIVLFIQIKKVIRFLQTNNLYGIQYTYLYTGIKHFV